MHLKLTPAAISTIFTQKKAWNKKNIIQTFQQQTQFKTKLKHNSKFSKTIQKIDIRWEENAIFEKKKEKKRYILKLGGGNEMISSLCK